LLVLNGILWAALAASFLRLAVTFFREYAEAKAAGVHTTELSSNPLSTVSPLLGRELSEEEVAHLIARSKKTKEAEKPDSSKKSKRTAEQTS